MTKSLRGLHFQVAIALSVLGLGLHPANAQQMDPRAYANVPTGLNFLIGGFSYSQGDVLVDPSIPIKDADAKVETGIVGYARTIALWGQSGTIGLVVPYASISANGLVEGEAQSVTRSGFGDPVMRLTLNLYGAPALSLKEFGGYQQDVIVGASLLITAPWGYYLPSKLVNIGTNRWSFKPELGVSKALGNWTVEAALGVTFFTDNDEFLGNSTKQQDPLYAVQGHLIYTFNPRLWGSLDATYFAGGRTTVNGILHDDLQQNSRFGATLSFAVDRSNSLKLYLSSGATSRTGTDFQMLGIAWQYLWADRQ